MNENQNEMIFAVLPVELINAINDYLTKQPYKDVVGYLRAIQQTVRVAKASALKDVKFEQPQNQQNIEQTEK